MKRRILLEVDVDDSVHGAMMLILEDLSDLMKKRQNQGTIREYGLHLAPLDLHLETGSMVPIETMDVPEED